MGTQTLGTNTSSYAPVATPVTTTKPAATNRRYIPEFDGLRGLSAIGVVAFHYFDWSRNANPIVSWTGYALYLSPGSVDMFFILSGFLIGTILLNSRESPNYYKTFYARRFYRIMPLYYAWLAIFFLFFFLTPGWGILHPAGYSTAGIIGIYLAVLQNNVVPVLNGSIWVGTSWTLGVEEPFYAIVPFCFRVKRKRTMAAIFMGTIAFSLLFRAFVLGVWAKGANWGEDASYYWTPSRISVPAWGCLLAVAWSVPEIKDWITRHVKLFYIGMPCFIAANVLLDRGRGWNIPHTFALYALFGRETLVLSALCLVTAVLAHPEGKLAGVMRWRVLKRFGTISYGMYLMHFGILWFMFRFIFHQQQMNTHSMLAVELLPIGFLVVWGIAELSWKYFEQPLVQRGQKYRY